MSSPKNSDDISGDLGGLAPTAIAVAGTTNGPDLRNPDARGAIIVLKTTLWTTDATITDLILQAKMSDGSYVTVQDWSALAIASAATFAFLVYPGASGTAGWKAAPASMPLPGQFRLQLVATRTTGSITAAISVKLQV